LAAFACGESLALAKKKSGAGIEPVNFFPSGDALSQGHHKQASPSPRFDPPGPSASPFQNTSAGEYVGIAACAECHAEEHRTFGETAHSLALSDVAVAAEPPDAQFFHSKSGRNYAVYRDGEQLRHREAATDEDGREYVAADFPVRYLIGSGRHTRSYLVEVDGFLSESPLTWYASRQSWDLSPEDWLLLGICRQRTGDLDEALRALDQAAAIAPFRPDIREALGQVHEWLGNADAAQRERSIAKRLTANSRPPR
jgi:tetratricopeptide (TPR) repeat protein